MRGPRYKSTCLGELLKALAEAVERTPLRFTAHTISL
jgi:hypothetical protein